MTFDVVNWNVEENVDWYVRIEDMGSSVTIGLFYNQSDSQHNTNRIAYAEDVVYGESVEVTLILEQSQTISLFQHEYAWHLIVNTLTPPGKVYHMRPFTELEAVIHPIYGNLDLIPIKGKAVIDAHTHVRIQKDIPLSTHIPDMRIGDVIRIDSTRRNVDELNQVVQHIISAVSAGAKVSLTSSISTVKFMEMTK